MDDGTKISLEDYYGGREKRVDDKIREAYPYAARMIETCWTLYPDEVSSMPREKRMSFWILPTTKYPEVSRAYSMLNEVIDTVPGSIIYVEEACRKFVHKIPGANINRPFSDFMIIRLWPGEGRRRLILRELEKACEQASNPTFNFKPKNTGGSVGGGGGGGPQQAISAVVHQGGKGGNS